MSGRSTKRAERRHHAGRMKQKAKRIYNNDNAVKYANHLAVCSCFGCGNPRRHLKESTMQEKRQSLREKDFEEDRLSA
jgi:hypothetical protein